MALSPAERRIAIAMYSAVGYSFKSEPITREKLECRERDLPDSLLAGYASQIPVLLRFLMGLKD